MTLEESISEKFTFIRKVVSKSRFIRMEGLSGKIPSSGRFDIAEFYQEKRLCKEFEVTVVRV